MSRAQAFGDFLIAAAQHWGLRAPRDCQYPASHSRRFDHIRSQSSERELRRPSAFNTAETSARVAQDSQSSPNPTGTSAFGQCKRTR
ncbi:MAG TPA: hypothetical protein VGF57_03475, partial [Roseiarcus sp.]